MPSTLEAIQESVIYQWEGETVLQILFENPEAIRALLARQTRLVRKRRETIADLAFQPVTGRVAKLLLEQVPASENSAQRDLTLDQMANTVGTTRELVSRTLHRFADEGLIRVNRVELTFLDREKLESLAGGSEK